MDKFLKTEKVESVDDMVHANVAVGTPSYTLIHASPTNKCITNIQTLVPFVILFLQGTS